MSEKIDIEIDINQIERDLKNGLDNSSEGESSSFTSGDGNKKSHWDGQDFISDSNMRLALGYKNGALIRILAKGLGKTATDMLKDLYVVHDHEVKIYKRVIQQFIVDYFPEYVEKISKISNGDLAALIILELTRWHEAMVLLKAQGMMIEVEVIK
jgi:hypothetical protein